MCLRRRLLPALFAALVVPLAACDSSGDETPTDAPRLVKEFEQVTLAARRDSAVFDLNQYFAGPAGMALTYEATGEGATVSGHRLVVKPKVDNAYQVTIKAKAPNGHAATGVLKVAPNANWCATTPPGTIDPLAFSTAQPVRFSLALSQVEVSYRRIQSAGTLTWTFMSIGCRFGAKTFNFVEEEVRTDTTYRLDPYTDAVISTTVSTVSEPRVYSVMAESAGTLPTFGKYAFANATGVPRFIPEAGYNGSRYTSRSSFWETASVTGAGLSLYASITSHWIGPGGSAGRTINNVSLVRLP